MESQMEMVRMASDMATQLHLGIWGDTGCCGCTVHRRRAAIFVFGLLILLASPFWFAAGQTEVGICCFPGALIFWIGAAICPNGFCGMYSAKKEWGVIRIKDIKYYIDTKARFDKEKLQQYDDDSNLIAPNVSSPLTKSFNGPYSQPSSPSESDPIVNKEAVLEFVRTYNGEMNLTSEELTRWIDRTYDDDYESIGWDKVVRRKKDILNVIELARKNVYKVENVFFAEVASNYVVYGYDFVNRSAPQSSPIGVNAFLHFARPGVFGNGTTVARVKKV